MVTPNLQVVTGTEAILGGVRGDWSGPDDVPTDLWESGVFTLRDFGKLAAHLARSAAPEPETDTALRELIAAALVKSGNHG